MGGFDERSLVTLNQPPLSLKSATSEPMRFVEVTYRFRIIDDLCWFASKLDIEAYVYINMYRPIVQYGR